MNADIHLEHRAGSSQGKHEGEPSLGLCDRLNRTRDNSQRQLPTDHDYAVPTREYQTDQSSLKTAPTAARSVFGKGKQRQRQKQPHYCAELTRSLHIRPSHSLNRNRARLVAFWADGRQYGSNHCRLGSARKTGFSTISTRSHPSGNLNLPITRVVSMGRRNTQLKPTFK